MSSKPNYDQLNEIADEIYEDVVKMSFLAGDESILASLSWVDIFVFLYWHGLRLESHGEATVNRDRVVMADATALPTYYAALSRRGFFNREHLWCHRSLGSVLQGRTSVLTPGVDAPFLDPDSAMLLAIGVSNALQEVSPTAKVFAVLSFRDCFAFAAQGGLNLLKSTQARICLICKFDDQDLESISKLRSMAEDESVFWGHSCRSEFNEMNKLFSDAPFLRPSLVCLKTAKKRNASNWAPSQNVHFTCGANNHTATML